MELNKSQYNYFRDELPTIMGKRIEVIMFDKAIDPVRSYHEYIGTIQQAFPYSVRFAEENLFHRVVVLDGTSLPLTPSRNVTIIFYPSFYTYMWRYIDGDEPRTAINVSSPKKGGKTKRKRKSKKVKNKT